MRLAWQRLQSNPVEKKTFEVNYGEIAYNNPVTSLELDKSEIIMNQGEEKELTATILPADADRCDVEGKYRSKV